MSLKTNITLTFNQFSIDGEWEKEMNRRNMLPQYSNSYNNIYKLNIRRTVYSYTKGTNYYMIYLGAKIPVVRDHEGRYTATVCQLKIYMSALYGPLNVALAAIHSENHTENLYHWGTFIYEDNPTPVVAGSKEEVIALYFLAKTGIKGNLPHHLK